MSDIEHSWIFYRIHSVFLKWHARLEIGLTEDEIYYFMQELLESLNDESDST